MGASTFDLIIPNTQLDWINQRSADFDQYIVMGDKNKNNEAVLFTNYSNGIQTAADSWMCNFSKSKISDSANGMVDQYNTEMKRFHEDATENDAKGFVDNETDKLNWHDGLFSKLKRGERADIKNLDIRQTIYRPYVKQYCNNDEFFVQRAGITKKIFPNSAHKNLAIALNGVGARTGFSALMVDTLMDREIHDKGQCFPLQFIEAKGENASDLFENDVNDYKKGDGVTDYGLRYFQAVYNNNAITKEDVFYYVYGLLHSVDYKTRFADNLSKQLPRIPAVNKEEDFWVFSDAGRKLGELHVNYEQVEAYPVTIVQGDLRLAQYDDAKAFFRVEQMKFAGKRPNLDKTTVHYNPRITMSDIPIEAYDYVVNGKPALEWVMERQSVKTDKKSGIVNDANDYANETMSDPAYPLELFQRVITVSLETMKIVHSLPKLDID